MNFARFNMLYCLTLKRNKFNQGDCKRFYSRIKSLPEFSHRENRRFYFDCTPELWEELKNAITAQNEKQGNIYNIDG